MNGPGLPVAVLPFLYAGVLSGPATPAEARSDLGSSVGIGTDAYFAFCRTHSLRGIEMGLTWLRGGTS